MAMMTISNPELFTTPPTLPMPITIPKKTATPPRTGTGVRCNLRASGLSTMFFSKAILTKRGCIQPTRNREMKNGIKML